MKHLDFCLTVVLAVVFAVPAFAQVGQGLSGPHYNLNIIGVPKDKTVPDMTGSDRHTIFVPLQSGGVVSRQVKIYYLPGVEFRVIDGNATDADNTATIEVPSSIGGDLCYDSGSRKATRLCRLSALSTTCSVPAPTRSCRIASV